MATGAGGRNRNRIFSFPIWHHPNSILSMTQFHWPGWSHTMAQRGEKNMLTDLRRQSQIKTTSDALQSHTHTHTFSALQRSTVEPVKPSRCECSLQLIWKMNRWQQKDDHPAVGCVKCPLHNQWFVLHIRLVFSTRILNIKCENIDFYDSLSRIYCIDYPHAALCAGSLLTIMLACQKCNYIMKKKQKTRNKHTLPYWVLRHM